MQHMMVARHGSEYTAKCGITVDTRRPAGDTFTGWWHKVTCRPCADAMNLTGDERARLKLR